MDAHTFFAGGARKPQRIVQRMKMRAAFFEDAAVIAVGRNHLADFLARNVAHGRVAVVLREMLDLFLQPVRIAALPSRMEKAGLQIAIDPVARDEVLHQRIAFEAEIPEAARPFAAKHFFERTLILALAHAELAAIAPRRAPADAFGFENHDGIAALREMKRGGKSRITRTHHADIGFLVACERRRGRMIVRRCGVVGGRMGHASQISTFSSLRSSA